MAGAYEKTSKEFGYSISILKATFKRQRNSEEGI